jgi:hypothetical protein
VSLFFAVRGIAADLRRVSDLTEIKHVEKEDKIISEGTEDGILDLSTRAFPGADFHRSSQIRYTFEAIR